MSTNKDDDFDGPGQEFSLPHEIVPIDRSPKIVAHRTAVPENPFPVAADSSESSAGGDFDKYIHALRRNWLLGTILGILAAGPLAATAWFLFPVQYNAVEFVRISQSINPLVFETADSGRSDLNSYRGYKSTQKQLLLQPLSLSKALKDPEVAVLSLVREQPDPISWLQGKLDVQFPDNSEMMNISLRLADPVAAHKIVKSVVDVYMADVVEKERAERLLRVERLEKILVASEDKVRKKRGELSGLVDRLGTSDSTTLNLSQQALLSQFSFLRTELSKVQFDILRAKSELLAKNGGHVNADGTVDNQNSENPEGEAAKQDGSTAEEITDPFVLEALERDPQASQLTKEVEQLKTKILSTEKRYDPKTAASYLTKYKAQLETAKQKLEDRTKRVVQLMDGKNSAPQSSNMPLPQKIASLEQQEIHLREEMSKLEVESRKYGRSSIDVEMMRQEISGLDPVVVRVSEEIERTKIELQGSSRIMRYPSAGIPTSGESKKRLPIAGFAGLVGLLLPLALLVLRDSLQNHVDNIRSVNKNMNLLVLGTIPRVPVKVMKRLNDPSNVDAKYWRERVSESMSAVTALLLRKLQNEGHRVIIICSAKSGEGKSTFSEQLARSLADSGHRTLLIDFDLRRPELHRRFNVPLDPGVCQVLRDGLELHEAIKETESPNLTLLTAGENVGSLLRDSANGSLDALFKRCRTEYELVIVDSCPLLPVVDGRVIGQYADSAILTLVKDVSQLGQVNAARDILNNYDINILGCVVSGEDSGGYYHNYGPGKDRTVISKGVTSSRSTSAM
jgi:polysaccharide biosynthesis transport protein